MTILLGLEHDDSVYIGCDSISLNGWAKDITASRKVFSKGSMLFAVAGNPRQAQLIQHYFDVPPDQAEGEDDEAYLVLEVVEPLRRLFKDKGFTETDNGRELGPSFLIGYRGKLYSVENAYQLCRSARGMYAMGIGDDFAIAALSVFVFMGATGKGVDPVQCILGALGVAAEFSTAVSEPFCLESISSRGVVTHR